MGFADDLVQIFQAHLVLDQNDEVVIFLFSTSRLPPRPVLISLTFATCFSFRSFSMTPEDAAQRGRILTGTVGLVGRQLQMLVDGALLVVVQAGYMACAMVRVSI